MTRRPSDSSSISSAPESDEQAELQHIASQMQHRLNNPLAALLAEAQLLSMEGTLAAEHRQAVQRIIDLVRRVIVLVRTLDSELGEARR